MKYEKITDNKFKLINTDELNYKVNKLFKIMDEVKSVEVSDIVTDLTTEHIVARLIANDFAKENMEEFKEDMQMITVHVKLNEKEIDISIGILDTDKKELIYGVLCK